MTTASAAGKATLRMSPQTKSAPSPSASRARATSRAHQLDAGEAHAGRRRRPSRPASGRAAPRRRRRSSRLASRPWPQPMSSTRAPRRDQAVRRGGGGTPDPSPACRARSARRSGRRGGTARSPARPARARPARPSRGSSRCRGHRVGAAPSARAARRQGDRAQAGARRRARAAPAAPRGPPAGRRRCAPRGRRAAAGCRRRPGRRARRASTRAGSRSHGVEAAPRPAHQLQPEAVQHRREERIAQAGRRAEEARRCAGDVGEHVPARAPISRAEAARPEQREGVRMAVAVVLHAVAAAHDLAAQRRVARARARRCRRRSRARRARRAGRARRA